MLGQFLLLNAKVDNLSQDVALLLEKFSFSNGLSQSLEENKFYKKFPLGHEEDLRNFEKHLNTSENYRKFVSYIALIGGASLSDAVKRAMRRTLSNELAVQYSWFGKKGKRAFGDILLSKALKEGVRESTKSYNPTEQKVESFMKTWLRHAKARLTTVKI